MILATFLLLAATPSTEAVPATEPNPKKMTQSAIRAHNAELPRDHAYFIRCVKSEETGSLIKRKLSCRTNQQWAAAEKAANDEARAIADAMRSKAGTSN
jgi:hypothetical protein